MTKKHTHTRKKAVLCRKATGQAPQQHNTRTTKQNTTNRGRVCATRSIGTTQPDTLPPTKPTHHFIRAPTTATTTPAAGQPKHLPAVHSTFTSPHYPTPPSSTWTRKTLLLPPPPPGLVGAGGPKTASGSAADAEAGGWIHRSATPPPPLSAAASTPGANSPLTYCRVIVATLWTRGKRA